MVHTTTLYYVSGLGADERVFARLRLKGVKLVYLPWLEPQDDESLDHYCRRLAEPIDTSKKFALLGLSFGGICVQHMTSFLNPQFLVLISTVKNRKEMPPYMRLPGIYKLRKVVPDKFYRWVGLHARNVLGVPASGKKSFEEMIMRASPVLLRWSVSQAVDWNGEEYSQPFIHVHGTKDQVFPARYIKNCRFVEGGSHFMVLNKAREVSGVIQEFIDAQVTQQKSTK